MVQMQKLSSIMGSRASEDDTMKLVSLVMSTELSFVRVEKTFKK